MKPMKPSVHRPQGCVPEALPSCQLYLSVIIAATTISQAPSGDVCQQQVSSVELCSHHCRWTSNAWALNTALRLLVSRVWSPLSFTLHHSAATLYGTICVLMFHSRSGRCVHCCHPAWLLLGEYRDLSLPDAVAQLFCAFWYVRS